EDFYHHDDALVAALRVLSIFAKKRGSVMPSSPAHAGRIEAFSSLFANFPKVHQSPEWRPHCPDDKKSEVIRKATEHFRKQYPCITMDGVRIDFGEGAWALIRQSNTSPRLSICMEARSPEALQKIETIIYAYMQGHPEVGA
ncbi:MAG: hypothetical protein AAB853_05170, partial [Patescibacteria group bacterium]